MIIHIHNITIPDSWSIEIWINNTSALQYASIDKLFKPVLHTGPESDIIYDIIAIRTQLNINLRGSYVHSYQDLKPSDPTPLEVQLNEGCERYAGDFRSIIDTLWHTLHPAIPPPYVPDSLTIANKIITNTYRSRLSDA